MTKATIIDGKIYAEAIYLDLAVSVSNLRNDHGVTPGLSVVLVGNDSASEIYVRNKHEQAKKIGIRSFVHKLPWDTTDTALFTLIKRLNDNRQVHGILVQLPLPSHISTQQVIAIMDPAKDVDGFHPFNISQLFADCSSITPCTPLGCLKLLQRQHSDMSGMHATIIGRSNIVGKPMIHLLMRENCTVTIAHSRTRNLPYVCHQADILVAAVGQPELVRGSWIKPGATVIDVGINHIPLVKGGNRLVGDVLFSEVVEVAGAITPVPGGVGPMTVAMLLHNTLLTCYRQELIDESSHMHLCV